MKIQTTFFLLLFTFLTCSTDIYAATKPGAKPTIWEIVEATPKKTNILDDVVDATNLNDVVEATGRKLDYDRTPVDNKVYKARVNPRIPETKAAIGSNAMKKLLRVSGWGYAAVEGVKLLLEGIDWIMDPEAQSIYRYKKNEAGFDCRNFGYKWVFKSEQFRCPIDAAQRSAEALCTAYPNQEGCKVVELWADEYRTRRLADVSDFVGNAIYVEIESTYKPTGTKVKNYERIMKGEKTDRIEGDKEVLTENDLADYMLGTHKDFQDQKYKDKLPKPNTWTGVAQQFKPENKFEEENSPTFKITQQVLDQANPESEDTTVKPTEPDPETGEKGWKFPPFCSWATPVCDFFQWFKEPPEKDDDQEDSDIDDKGIFSKTFDYVFSLSKQCPPDIPIDFETKYISGSFTFSLKWLCMIFTFLGYPIVFASHCTGIWILYEAVIRKEFRG